MERPFRICIVYRSVEHDDESLRRSHPGPNVEIRVLELRRARLAAGLTLAQAATIASTTKRHLMVLEGWTPSIRPPAARLATVERLAAMYGVEPRMIAWVQR